MVIYQHDPFREAVAAAIGRKIPDTVWADCNDDWVVRERFDSGTTGQRSAIVRKVARRARDEITKALTIAAEVAEVEIEEDHGTHDRAAMRRQDGPAVVPEHSEPVAVALSEYEQDRAWAFSMAIASQADVRHGHLIQRFREKKLGGRLVRADDAEAWLRSPENRSLAGDLAREGEYLAQFMPAWSADDAGFYILTGHPPPIHPLRGSFSRAHLAHREQRGVVTIEVEPWVSEKTVARLYRDVRAHVLPRHDARPRGMAVWRFVESQHAELRPTLRDVWGNLTAQAYAKRPARPVPFREVWRHWRAAHPELESLTITECWRRWNAEHSDDAGRQFRIFKNFRDGLLSGVEHGSSITWPGYQMLSTSPEHAGADSI